MGVADQDGSLFPPQGGGMGDPGLQNEVHDVGVISTNWDHQYEGIVMMGYFCILGL